MKAGSLALSLSAASLALTVAIGGNHTAEARLIAPEVNDAAILGDGDGNRMPRTLEEYGFFIHADAQIPTLGVVPYELNTPLYSDGADKIRFIYLPEGGSVSADAEVDGGLLQFPVGSAIIKTFAFGEGDDRQLIETRVLLHRANGWTALPYRWNEDQTEARLALAGARITMTRPDGEEISYRIPNKNQCKTCHSQDNEIVPIGPKMRNLSHEDMAELTWAGPDNAPPQFGASLPVWSDRANVADVTALARGYLDVNCAHCHQPKGMASNAGIDFRWQQDAPRKLGIMKPPVAAGRGAGGHKFSVTPGDPDGSILIHRLESTEAGVAMPELGRSSVHRDGVDVLRRWIAEMDMPANMETSTTEITEESVQ